MDSNKSTIQDLLNDMVQFLGKTLVSESLSRKAERSRIVLLRSLELHAQRNGVTLEADYEEPSTVAAGQTRSSSSNFIQSEDSVKVTIPFSELQKTSVKSGPLQQRQKGISLYPRRTYWTGLYKHFLLMYTSQRNVKPCTSVNIQGFVARPAPSFNKDQKNKKDVAFEIVCPGKRNYQFIARTVKDMEQWVVAICQASVQHIHSSVPLLNVHATDENDSEIYDDAGSGTHFNEEIEDSYKQSEEEEFYQDITDVCQRNLVLESEPGFEMKPAEEHPPLPPRRCLPSAFEDNLSDQESVYDDILVTLIEPGRDVDREEKHSWVQQNIPIGHKNARSQLFVKREVQNDDNGEEEIYDDVGVTKELPKLVKLPYLQPKLYVQNGGGVQDRIREHETCHSNVGIPTCGHKSNSKISNQFQQNIRTTSKSITNHEKDIVTSLPQTPTAYHNSKYNISNQTETNKRTVFKYIRTTQEEAKIFSPRTLIATQRPETPPRSYLKQ